MREKNKLIAEERKVFASQMKKYRLKQILTLEALSYRSNISPTYLSGIESCKKNITIESSSKIAKALHVPLFMLFVDIERCINSTENGRFFLHHSNNLQQEKEKI